MKVTCRDSTRFWREMEARASERRLRKTVEFFPDYGIVKIVVFHKAMRGQSENGNEQRLQRAA